MAFLALIFVTIILILYIIYKYMTYRPPNFPPGPPRIPLFGSYLFLLILNSNHIHKAILVLCKYYKSKIIGLYHGSSDIIVVANDYKSVKELLNNKEFDGRPDMFQGRLREPNLKLKGIFNIDGIGWRDQRRFILRHLRDWGFGCRSQSLEYEIRDEICSLIEILKYGPIYPHEESMFKNGSVLCPDIFFAVFMNSFLKILCGERIPREDQKELFYIGQQGMIFQKNADDYGRLLSIFPWIRFIFPVKSGYKPIKEGNNAIYEFLKKVIDIQLKTYDENQERHVIDLYISEMRKAELEGNKDTKFLYDQLVMSCTDFAFPVLTAMTQQITFLIQRIFLYPEIQNKIQNEIDEIVGQGRLPNLDDRINLSYTEATIREILRHETLVPSSIPHKALVATKFCGYDIPKGTIMMPGLYAFHNDKELWEDPENFRPERFLDENGKLSLKKDISLPFGAGKRLCAGETFARNGMFLLTTALFQNFNVEIPNGFTNYGLSHNGTGLITYTPDDFYVKFTPR